MPLGLGGGWLQRDVVAESLELGDEAFGVAFGVAALEVVAAEVVVGLAGGEHVPVGDQHRVFDGAERAAVSEARFQAPVLGGEVAVAGADGGQRGLFEGDPSHLQPLRVRPERRLPADWSLPGQRPAQEARCRAVGKTRMSVPISATMTSAVRAATPVIVAASATPAWPVGPSSVAIASVSRWICSSRKSRWASMAPMTSAWWGWKRPSSASRSAGSLARSRPLASSASCSGS